MIQKEKKEKVEESRKSANEMELSTRTKLPIRQINRGQSYKVVRHRYSNPMIQPEPEGSTQGYPLDSVEVLRLNNSAGNPVKDILLKLNLPDHRSILTDSKILKDGGEDKEFQRSFRNSDTERLSRSDEVLKLKNFKKDATLKLFKSTNQERYEHVGPEVTSSQDGKVYKMAKRDYAWLMISRCSRSHIHIKVKVKGMCSSLKVKITTTYSQEEEKKEIQVCEHKNEDSA
ncbi:hypothetical protein Tco_0834863 [Tanacetum coccineum]